MKALKSGIEVKLRRAPFYVVSRDRFMSGWGGAEGRDNICIVPCEDEETAKLVAAYCSEVRTDQEHVRILTSQPDDDGQLFSDLSDWIGTARRLYAQNKEAMDAYMGTAQL